VKIPFLLREEKERYAFCPTKRLPDGSLQPELLVEFSPAGEDAFVLTVHYPHRRLVTVFERCDRQ
jgi:hypothetical protein